MSGLEVADVVLEVGGRRLIDGLSFHVAPGGVVCLMGPSGVGKSTLLAYLAGFLDPAFQASGRVALDGRDLTRLPPERRGLGLLFQDDLLFPHLSVGANVAFGLAAKRGDRRAAVAALLADAGLEGYGTRDPATLSGGQRARVALLRTLAAEPKALLLDEPFGKLDAELRRDFRALVFERASRGGLPVVLVTHDPADADAAGGRVIHLKPSAAA